MVAFYDDHGLTPRDAMLGGRNALADSETTFHSEDPKRYEVTIELEGDRISLLVTAGGEVVECDRGA